MDEAAIKTHARIEAMSHILQFMLAGHLSRFTDEETRLFMDTLLNIFAVPDDAPEIAGDPARALHRAEVRMALEIIGDGAMRQRAMMRPSRQ